MSTRTVSSIDHAVGTVDVPGDKSISHRAVLIGAVADGETIVNGFLESEDCLNTVRALEAMGVPIEQEGETLTIQGVGLGGLQGPSAPIDLGNSGTGIRLLAGLAAGQPFMMVLTGDSSVRRRPMARIVRPLRLMGARIQGEDGDTHAPLHIEGGELSGICYDSPVASAQVKSAILLAGLFASGETSVTEPYRSRDHTERMLSAFGARLRQDRQHGQDVSRVVLEPGATLMGQRLVVPGDLSSAAFFIVAGLLVPNSDLLIKNVGINETRSGLLDALVTMGARLDVLNTRHGAGEPVADLRVRTSRLHGAAFDGPIVVRMIDEIPILALAASQADGETVIRSAGELRVKESDRIAAICSVLGALGVHADPEPDGFRIVGPQPILGGSCDSVGDHRIGMTAAVAGLIGEAPVTVSNVACIGTSFPNFWETLVAL